MGVAEITYYDTDRNHDHRSAMGLIRRTHPKKLSLGIESHCTIVMRFLGQQASAQRSFRCDESAAALYVLCEGARGSSDQGKQPLRPWSSSRLGLSRVVSRRGGVERLLYDVSCSELRSGGVWDVPIEYIEKPCPGGR